MPAWLDLGGTTVDPAAASHQQALPARSLLYRRRSPAGRLLPVLGVVVITALIPLYWLPIPGEMARSKCRRGGGRE